VGGLGATAHKNLSVVEQASCLLIECCKIEILSGLGATAHKKFIRCGTGILPVKLIESMWNRHLACQGKIPHSDELIST